MAPEDWLCGFCGECDQGNANATKMAAKLVVNFHSMEFEFRDKSILTRISNEADRIVQTGVMAAGLLPEEKPEVSHGEDFESVTFSWSKFGSVVVKFVQHKTGIEYQVEWQHKKSGGTLRDSFLMESTHWYGAAQVKHQHWPIEKWSRPEAAYVTGDSFKDQYGGVLERYWLSSHGCAVYVDDDIPLFVGMNHKNDGKLSLCSKWSSPYNNIKNEPVKLTYRIFLAENVRLTHELATGLVFRKPEAIPDEDIFRYPIWSTWARYKKEINQEVVLEFVKDIKKNGFKASQVEIDDDWTPRYGDMDFNEAKFPNPKKMIDDIKDLGFRVTLWMHPFASPMSQASKGDYWIKSGFLPGHTTWWNGVGKLLDVTNPEAVNWFKNNMAQLKEKYGLTSFKFDAGEANWLPNFANPKTPWGNPNEYSTKYAQMCYECDTETRAQEVRVGSGTQHLPIFVRMMDKDSNWSFNNGLKSLIPHVLTFSVLGYPFVLPDMIGGNAYASFGLTITSSPLPEKELFIRWLQANVFLPSLQFSLCPWQYEDSEVLKITKEMTELHEKYADTLIALAKESVETGAPIIRPLWWLAPNDERAQIIDDQFLVGDDIVVAPVVVKGATDRTIYLPPGEWYDVLRKKVLKGCKVYPGYEVALSELPYFTRVKEGEENGEPAGEGYDLTAPGVEDAALESGPLADPGSTQEGEETVPVEAAVAEEAAAAAVVVEVASTDAEVASTDVEVASTDAAVTEGVTEAVNEAAATEAAATEAAATEALTEAATEAAQPPAQPQPPVPAPRQNPPGALNALDASSTPANVDQSEPL